MAKCFVCGEGFTKGTHYCKVPLIPFEHFIEDPKVIIDIDYVNFLKTLSRELENSPSDTIFDRLLDLYRGAYLIGMESGERRKNS